MSICVRHFVDYRRRHILVISGLSKPDFGELSRSLFRDNAGDGGFVHCVLIAEVSLSVGDEALPSGTVQRLRVSVARERGHGGPEGRYAGDASVDQLLFLPISVEVHFGDLIVVNRWPQRGQQS